MMRVFGDWSREDPTTPPSYVYVVAYPAGIVIGVWTDEDELRSWLACGERRATGWQLTRHSDGRPWEEPVELDKHTLEPLPRKVSTNQ